MRGHFKTKTNKPRYSDTISLLSKYLVFIILQWFTNILLLLLMYIRNIDNIFCNIKKNKLTLWLRLKILLNGHSFTSLTCYFMLQKMLSIFRIYINDNNNISVNHCKIMKTRYLDNKLIVSLYRGWFVFVYE